VSQNKNQRSHFVIILASVHQL